MKNLTILTLTAATVAATALGLATPATAASSTPSTVDQTVAALQAQGYQVVLDKVGAAPLNQCSVGAVRPGQIFSRTDSGAPGAGGSVVTTITNKTVFVDVAC